ncbi:hemagglutinin repeat-containing protein [Neisseria weixii]|nr:hemagglutinin repeat-containing protein [Neisseria weixii]ATD64834.1 PspA [Neisseria weixii]
MLNLSATDIQNSGVVQGGKVRLRGQDVNIDGGTVEADTLLAVEAGRTVIQSSGGTTLKGAQVKGKGVALSTRNLNIESIQDSAVYRSKQQNLSGSVTVGYGASATADYNQSKTNADHRSISEQSGIFAGDDGDSQSGVTKSGIGTRNIVIANDTDGTQAKAAYTATRSETAEADSGRLKNVFDKERVQNEIDLQRNVSQDFSRNVQEARTEINRKAEGYKALANAAEDNAAQALQNGDLNAYREAVQTANEHHQKADNWQKGGVALAAVATGLSAPTDSALGIAAATASPAAYQIGQYFKGLAAENSDGRLTAAQESARVVAHGVIAAATAAAGDNNALTAALSAGGAEAAAPYVSQWLYGEKDGSKLTTEQKQAVSNILSLGG